LATSPGMRPVPTNASRVARNQSPIRRSIRRSSGTIVPSGRGPVFSR
jgi:hypothetical protein